LITVSGSSTEITEIHSMKKFIVALDGLKLSESSIQTAIQLTKQHQAHLVGVFLDDFTRNSFSVADALQQKNMEELVQKDQLLRDTAVKLFEEKCQAQKVNFTVRRDKNFAIQDLLRESIYADLLVISADETFTRFEEPAPTRFLRDLLSEVQCPVIVTHHNVQPLEKVVMLYDGAPSSVYAIKMFTSTLSAAKLLPTEVVTVKGPEDDSHLPENKLMKEFMKRHSPDAVFTILKGEPEASILEQLKHENETTLIVLGAYQRSNVSRWFRSSMADLLLKELKSPLFIAHNK
jgi:nucleotide-binding universal stress UspA family protein